MKVTARVVTALLFFSLCTTVQANKYGSVEPIANPAVIDTGALTDQPLEFREAFARQLLQCGIVSRVVDALTSTGAVTTINVLTDSLGYVLSQASAFLLDANDPTSFDFEANYVVLNFATPPPLAASAALFETVGQIDPLLFETDTSGYTQFGRAYLSLQSDVVAPQFIAGYVAAALQAGVEYTPIVNGVASLFRGGAAFPGNDWTVDTLGEEYLGRIPTQSHGALDRIRAFHLRTTQEVLRRLEHGRRSSGNAVSFHCR